MRFANRSGAICAAMLFVFVSAQALAQELSALDDDGRAAALPIVHESLRVMIGCASCAVGSRNDRGIASWAWLAIALCVGRRVLRVRWW